MQIDIPECHSVDAVAQLTQTDNLHQKILYIECMPAAGASATFDQNAETIFSALIKLSADEYQPEEVKLAVAQQLGPVGNISSLLSALVTFADSCYEQI